MARLVFCDKCGRHIPPKQEFLKYLVAKLCPNCYEVKPLSMNIALGDLVEVKGMKGKFKVISIERVGDRTIFELFSLTDEKLVRIASPPYEVVKLKDPIEKLKEGVIDDPYEFELFVNAKLLSQIHQYDPISSLAINRIDAVPHQIDAVYRMLEEPMPRFLLADDVGLGKTVIAGMILKELKLRGRIKNALIVVPAGLKNQWLRELRDKFGEDFVIVDSSYVKTHPVSPWTRERFIIASMDWLKQKEVLKSLEPLEWDCVIIDEAHKLRAHRHGMLGEKQTQRYKLGSLLSNNSKSLLLLTATPHSGDSYSFYKLVSLVNPYLFASEHHLSKEKLSRIMIRRLKEQVKNFDGSDIFPARVVKSLPVRFSSDEQRLYDKVREYVLHYFNLAKSVRNRGVSFAMMVLQKRMASSIVAIRKSLERRIEKLRTLLEKPERIIPEKVVKLMERWLRDPDSLEESERERVERAIELLTLAEKPSELIEEIKKLEELIRLAKGLEQSKIDSKAKILLEFVKGIHEKDPNEKILVFTEFTDTLDYLKELFEKEGYTVAVIHGAMDIHERVTEEARFKEDPNVRIMVATDAAGEGINLQFAHIMINYDLPWNPNRLEQRMGRLHRYGQRRNVFIYNLLIENSIEGYVFDVLLRKIEAIKQEMGEHVFDVLGVLLSKLRLDEIIMESIRGREWAERKMNEVTQMIDENLKLLKKLEERLLIKDMLNLDQIKKLIEKHEQSLVTEDDIRLLVLTYFLLNDGEIRRLEDGTYQIQKLPEDLKRNEEVINSIGTLHGSFKRIAFSRDVAEKTGAEFIGLGHPLLNGIIDNMLSKHKAVVTVKFDPKGRNGAIFIFNGKVENGNGDLCNERLFAIFYDVATSSTKEVPIQCIREFESPPENFALTELQFDIQEAKEKSEKHAILLLDKILDETREKILRRVNIKRKDLEEFALARLQYLEKEIEKTASELRSRQSMLALVGELSRLKTEISLLESKQRKLIKEKEDLKQKIVFERRKLDGEAELHVLSPELVGICLVFPKLDETSKKEVEKIGMELAMEYEKSHGREPKDVSLEFRGYDIESKSVNEERCIEVKSFKESGSVELTWHEWLTAKRLKEKYWLYVVEGCANKANARLFLIQNPYNLFSDSVKLVIQPKIIINYWKEKALPCNKED